MPELDHLMAGLLSGDDGRAEASVPGLAALGEQAVPRLLEAAHSKNPDHRWWAVRALAESRETPAERLLPFLKDPAPEVRQAAALGLAAHAAETAIPELIRALHDEDPLVASLASNALVKAGPASVPALLETLRTGPPAVRIPALRALAELKDHRAIPALLEMAGAESAVIAHWAEEGLERLGLNMVYIKQT